MKEKLHLNVAIITVSDRAASGTYDDLSGPAAKETLARKFDEGDVKFDLKIVPDEPLRLHESIKKFVNDKYDLVITTGGTGIGPRDITPEVTKKLIDKEIPGIGEAMRSYSMSITKNAMLSRGCAGVAKETLIVNLPGSPKAVSEILDYLSDTIKHAYYMIRDIDVHS
ncbi:MAG: MogA/MoaB family molybdenum cofactor biosynthesis protein [Pseudomonadota bacterium]